MTWQPRGKGGSSRILDTHSVGRTESGEGAAEAEVAGSAADGAVCV